MQLKPCTQSSRPWRTRQHGATLLEVLITVLLISFGLLAMAGMQAYSIAVNANSINRGIATAMASEYADMIRANPTAFAVGWYDHNEPYKNSNRAVNALSAANVCVYPNCTPATLAEYEKNMTLVRLKAALPAGDLALVRVTKAGAISSKQADLWVIWMEQELNKEIDADGKSTEKSFDNCPLHVQKQYPLPRCFYMRVSL